MEVGWGYIHAGTLSPNSKILVWFFLLYVDYLTDSAIIDDIWNIDFKNNYLFQTNAKNSGIYYKRT